MCDRCNGFVASLECFSTYSSHYIKLNYFKLSIFFVGGGGQNDMFVSPQISTHIIFVGTFGGIAPPDTKKLATTSVQGSVSSAGRQKLRCYGFGASLVEQYCACTINLVNISELCEDCAVANEIDKAWTYISWINVHTYHFLINVFCRGVDPGGGGGGGGGHVATPPPMKIWGGGKHITLPPPPVSLTWKIHNYVMQESVLKSTPRHYKTIKVHMK